MAVKVLKSSVHKNGNEYLPNEIIKGLDKREERRLVNKGYCEFIKLEKSSLSVDEFSSLKADDQKSILSELGMEPGTNEKERVKQYTDWLESKKLMGLSPSDF